MTTDSDVEVQPNYLREIVPPLLDPKVGMLTCLYRGKNVTNFFSGLTAIGMSVEMPAGVLVADLLAGMKFGLGPTTVVRKDALASIGGYTALRDYIAYDFAIGNLMTKAGYRIVLSRHVIDHVVSQKSFRHMWQNQLRWAQTTRYSRPKGHFGSGLIFAMPYGLLWLPCRRTSGALETWRGSSLRGNFQSINRSLARGLEGGAGSRGAPRAMALPAARFAGVRGVVRQLPEVALRLA